MEPVDLYRLLAARQFGLLDDERCAFLERALAEDAESRARAEAFIARLQAAGSAGFGSGVDRGPQGVGGSADGGFGANRQGLRRGVVRWRAVARGAAMAALGAVIAWGAMRTRTEREGTIVPASGTVVILDATRDEEVAFDLMESAGEVVTFVADVYLDDRVARWEVLSGDMTVLVSHKLVAPRGEPRLHTISMQVPAGVLDGFSGGLWVVIRDHSGGVVREWSVRAE